MKDIPKVNPEAGALEEYRAAVEAGIDQNPNPSEPAPAIEEVSEQDREAKREEFLKRLEKRPSLFGTSQAFESHHRTVSNPAKIQIKNVSKPKLSKTPPPVVRVPSKVKSK